MSFLYLRRTARRDIRRLPRAQGKQNVSQEKNPMQRTTVLKKNNDVNRANKETAYFSWAFTKKKNEV